MVARSCPLAQSEMRRSSGAQCRTPEPFGIELLSCRPDRMTFPALADLIGLLANPNETSRDHVPPYRPTSIQKLAVREFVLAAQVVLRQYFSVGLELIWTYGLPSHSIECFFKRSLRIAVVGRDRRKPIDLCRSALPRLLDGDCAKRSEHALPRHEG